MKTKNIQISEWEATYDAAIPVGFARKTSRTEDELTALDPPSCPTPRILVVEDDTGPSKLFSEELLRSGYEVDTAENIEAAWQALNAMTYDPRSYNLLITDNHLPTFELVQHLRSAHIHLPVILASGTIPTEELARIQWLQPVLVLPKSFGVEQLLATVKEALTPPPVPANEGRFPRVIQEETVPDEYNL